MNVSVFQERAEEGVNPEAKEGTDLKETGGWRRKRA